MGGAARYRGKNINDLLAPGLNLLPDLPAILVRLCFKPVGFTGDISQMFLCIHLPLEDRKYHRFLWNSGAERETKVYQFQRYLFENVGSLVVANYVVKEHAECHREELPLAWKTVRNAMLVDDVLEVVQTVEEARETIHQLVELHQKAGMSLGKWASSDESVLEGLESTGQTKGVDLYHVEVCDPRRPILKALGMVWDTGPDLFHFDTAGEDPGSWTRRKMASVVARIFDPLGLVSPVVIIARSLLQCCIRVQQSQGIVDV